MVLLRLATPATISVTPVPVVKLVEPASITASPITPNYFLSPVIQRATQVAIPAPTAMQIYTREGPQPDSNMGTIARGTCFETQTVTVLARVTLPSIGLLTQASVDASHITLKIFELANRTATLVQAFTALTAVNLVFDALQIDSRWTTDTIGYNFKHEYDPAATTGSAADPSAHYDLKGNTVYRFEYTFGTDDDGTVVVVAEVGVQEIYSS